MKKKENLYHITIFWIFILALVIVSILAVLQDPAVRKKPEKADPVPVPIVKEGEFFKVGKYGNTIILDVQTERTNGLETQIDEAGKATRFLIRSQDKKGS